MTQLRRKVLANSIILVLTTVGTRALMFVLAVLVINRLGDLELIGRFGTAFGYGVLVASTVDFGMRQLLLRAAGSLRHDLPLLDELVRRCSLARALNWLAFLLLGGPLLWLSGYDTEAVVVIGIFALYGYFDAGAFQNKFLLRGFQAAHREAMLTALGRGSILVFGLALVGSGRLNVPALGLCFVAGAGIENLLAWRSYRALRAGLPEVGAPLGRQGTDLAEERAAHSLPALYRASSSLGASVILHTWAQRMPIVLMPALGSVGGLALFSAAVRIPEAATSIPSNVMSAIIPVLARRERGGHDAARTNQVIEYMLLASVLVVALLSLEAASFTTLLFKPDLAESMLLLAMLAPWLGLIAMAYTCGGLAIAFHGERAIVRAYGALFAISYLGGVVLVPRYDIEGAILVQLVGLAINLAILFAAVSRLSGRLTWSILRRPVPCGAAAMGAWWAGLALWPAHGAFWLRSGAALFAAGLVFLAVSWPRRRDDFLLGLIARRP